MSGLGVDELDQLEAYAAALQRCADLDDLCWAVQDPVAGFGFPDCVLYVRRGNVLMQMSASGPKRLGGRRIADRIALALHQGIVGAAASSGAPLYVADTRADSRYVEDVMPGRAEFAVPVVYRGEVIGVLDAEHPETDGFSPRDRQLLNAVAEIAAPHLGQLLEQRSFSGAQRLGDVAADLARLPCIGEGALAQALAVMVERAAHALRVNRVNVWRLEADCLRCEEHFDLRNRRRERPQDIPRSGLQAYLAALSEERVIIANEALDDSRTACLQSYLLRHDISALLDAPIRVGGALVAVLRVEHTRGARRWTIEEASFVATLGDFVAMTWLNAQKAETQRQLLHAQKLESLGRLSGGVAHEFNNLLTVLSGSLEALRGSAGLRGDDQATIQLMGETIERAGKLTRQLLALGRQQTLQLMDVDIPTLVDRSADLLRNGLPAGVTLRVDHARPATALCDAAQIEQVLTNLVLNAADAMPDGGEVQVATSVERAPAGSVVCIAVHDSGVGIPLQQQHGIFDPFYSTKGDRGSGLGLAVCMSVVQQHGGHIDVCSAEGQGATFRVFLPLRAVAATMPAPAPAVRAPAISAPVVVVEDEPGVRQVIMQMLELLGVRAVAAASADEALELIRTLKPNLLISDVIMPGTNGPQLYAAAVQFQPPLKVLFVSGYSRELLGDPPWSSAQYGFLEKPFTVRSLGDALAGLLADGTDAQVSAVR